MPHFSASDIYMHTMCICMPLRLGVLLTALLQMSISFLYFCNRSFFVSLFRPFTGGYALVTDLAVGAVEITGLLFSLVGVIGAWNAKSRLVATYNWWQLARLAVWAFVLFVDVPLLIHCEDWVNNVEAMTALHGWNQVMFDIAINANCSGERTRFLVLSSLTLVFYMYLVFATSRYIEFLDRVPKHLLRMPKDLSSGVFFARPLGDEIFPEGDEYGTFDGGQDPFGPAPAMGMHQQQTQQEQQEPLPML